MISLFDCPLFLGLTPEEQRHIGDTLPKSLRHVKRGAVIVHADTEATDLVCVLDGWVETSTRATGRTYMFTERYAAPVMIEPERLFGANRDYRTTYRAFTLCDVLRIDKHNIAELLDHHLVCRLNYLNAVCRRATLADSRLWNRPHATLEDAVINFVRSRSQYPAGYKRLDITMKTLAQYLNEQTIKVSQALHNLEDRELIRLSRGSIEVPALQLCSN